MLNQIYAFKVSIYNIDRVSGYNSLVCEVVKTHYHQAILTRRRLLHELSDKEKLHTNIVVDEVILIK